MRAHTRKTPESEKILTYLCENGGATAREIAEKTGLDYDTVFRTLRKLNGWSVKCRTEGKTRGPKTWRLV